MQRGREIQPARKLKRDVYKNSRLYDLGLSDMLCDIDIKDCGYALKGCVN